jgi:hypothetical protein
VTQYFAFRNFKLWRAPLPTRVLLTMFNAMMVVATAIGVLMYRVRTGLTPAGTKAWYLGNEATARPGEEMLFARTLPELLDVTHPHAFEESFMFFVLCHIFALTNVRDGWKIAVYVASFASLAVDLATPYLIRYVSPAFAPLQLLNGAVMGTTLLVLLAVPTYEMWLYREPTPAPPEA